MTIKNKKAFTLIELIVVVTILALLAAVAVPMISGWVEKAGESERAENARTIELLIKAFMAEKGLTELPEPIPGHISGHPDYEVLYNQYLVQIMTGEAFGLARLNNPGTGHYSVDKSGNVTVIKAASPADKGRVDYEFANP